MKNKYTTPQLLVSEILIETGFATSQGGQATATRKAPRK